MPPLPGAVLEDFLQASFISPRVTRKSVGGGVFIVFQEKLLRIFWNVFEADLTVKCLICWFARLWGFVVFFGEKWLPLLYIMLSFFCCV